MIFRTLLKRSPKPLLQRRRESTIYRKNWIPVSAGMTTGVSKRVFQLLIKVLGVVMVILTPAGPAWAKLNVVATLPWIGSLAEDIGKDQVKVTTLVKASQDPHYVEAKPSMILEVRRADILMYNGLDLEVGYLPVLVESSRNAKIQAGTPGNFDCSRFISPIDLPSSVDRSMGDVHPLGNPHYHLSPENVSKVAEGMAQGLAKMDPTHADFYQKNLVLFQQRMGEKKKEWGGRSLKGKKFLPYHKFFEYLARDFGFEIVGYIEPKPGIPPSAGYVEKIIEGMKKNRPDAILVTNYAGEKEGRFLSQKTGVKVVVVPHDVGATPECKDWFSLMDQVLKALG
jgi:zinc/manganese transport system substrate-binding protein